jgi:hypothetical protein
LASRLSFVEPVDAAGAGAGVELEELVADVELAGAAGVVAEELLFEELPHPASATMPTSAGRNASRLRTGWAFA